MNWNIFKRFKKPIIIPLVRDNKPTGQWVECFKDDEIYNKLKKIYGEVPTQIEVEPLVKQ